MRLKLSDLPKSVVQQYNMEAKATRDGYLHMDIRRGMYDLPQAGLIVQQLLEKGSTSRDTKIARSHWDFGRTIGA